MTAIDRASAANDWISLWVFSSLAGVACDHITSNCSL